MAVLAADIESRTVELSDGSFEAFCDDIAGMFDADVTCTRQDVGTGTVKDVQKHFKKLTAVHHVKATGALDGTFHLFFDQGGLFILSGVIVMLPPQRILEEIKRGSIDEAESLADAAREVGNVLVGSWDRLFRGECQGHDHFLKMGTFIGKPWENLDEMGLGAEEELVFALYEMTVDSYPSFRCAAVFPKTVLQASSQEAIEPSAAQAAEDPLAGEPRKMVSEAPVAAVAATSVSAEAGVAEPVEAVSGPAAESLPSDQADAEPEAATEEETPKSSPAVAETPSERVDVSAVAETIDPAEAAQVPEDIQPTVEAVVGHVDEVTPETPMPRAAEPPGKSDTGYIDRMFNDLVEYSCDTGIAELLKVPAKDIMVTEVVWSDPGDTVQDVVAKMQQHNTGYVLVGQDGVLEGLVSNSSILGAMSPYLRPLFAKWRRPEDDATLGIKIKWVMSRPVRTVTPDATLASMVESMSRYGGRCLPVVDSQAKVQGIVTVFDILLRVLEADKSFSWAGKPPQAPPLLI